MTMMTNRVVELGTDAGQARIGMYCADMGSMLLRGRKGSGKSTAVRQVFGQLAPRADVQFVGLAGAQPHPVTGGEFGALAPRCAALAGDDAEQAGALLAQVASVVRQRLNTLAKGGDIFTPSVDRPLIVLLVDEVQVFTTHPAVRESLTMLTKLGRAGGALTLSTSSATGYEHATALQDIADVLADFGWNDTTGRQRARGEADISGIPLTLGSDPTVDWRLRVLFPLVTAADAAQVAADTAGLTRPIPGVTVGTEHLRRD